MSVSRMSRSEPLRLMRTLKLVGLDFLDPLVLAALADERPLLLIGPHGSAKSELRSHSRGPSLLPGLAR